MGGGALTIITLKFLKFYLQKRDLKSLNFLFIRIFMRKIMSMLALMAILGTSNASAENEGFFMGGALLISGIQKTKSKYEYIIRYYDDNEIRQGSYLNWLSFVLGYTHDISDKFGLRYYGVIDANGFFAMNYNANIDMLYTLTQSESAELRAFAGAWLGYANFDDDFDDGENNGLDLGVNAGVRAVFGQKHGVDFYARFGFLTQSKEYDRAIYGVKSWEVSQPYLIGVRYTYTF